MATQTQNHNAESIAYKLIKEEARELSWKLQNTIYVIYRNNSFFTTMSKEKGHVLCAFNLGNEIAI
jgi:hypothetical protein